ncbi:hypothetical protein WH47_08395, partial [Habropoda laboriosa]
LIKTGETITVEKYYTKTQIIHKKFLKMQPALVYFKRVILLFDNARPSCINNRIKTASVRISSSVLSASYQRFRSLDNF